MNATSQRPSTAPRRIVVRSVNWLGDAVMTTPALLRLRARFPDSRIAVLTAGKLADLWKHHAAVDEVLTFAQDEGVLAVSHTLRREHFDLALVFPNSPRSALETWLARITMRAGYARGWRSVFLTNPVSDRPGSVKMRKRSEREIQRLIAQPGCDGALPVRSEVSSGAHQIHEYLHLVGTLGASEEPLAPTLTVSDSEVESVAARFNLGTHEAPLVGLNPGAEYGPAKRWPKDYFVTAVRLVQQQVPCMWLILGGKGDVATAGELESRLGFGNFVRNLAGQTSLRELMAVLKLCRVIVTNDTGPMHVAAALGTTVVVPFGSTSPELTGPGIPGAPNHVLLQSTVPCAPCYRRECPIDLRCMRGISPSFIADAILERLRSQRG